MTIQESYLKPDQINSKFLKHELAYHLFWQLHYSIVIDEWEFIDLLGVKRSNYTAEYEIKISKSDLSRELRLIKMLNAERGSKDYPKWVKHAKYLGKNIKKEGYDLLYSHTETKFFVPNEFYFYVPDFLVDYAVEETENLPYGVVKIGGRQYNSNYIGYDRFEIIKKAKRLHENKIESFMFYKMAHALTVRNRLFSRLQNP
jgi:hypothetical protein